MSTIDDEVAAAKAAYDAALSKQEIINSHRADIAHEALRRIRDEKDDPAHLTWYDEHILAAQDAVVNRVRRKQAEEDRRKAERAAKARATRAKHVAKSPQQSSASATAPVTKPLAPQPTQRDAPSFPAR